MRTRFQGVTNIVRFNWHFFLAALIASIVALSVSSFLPDPFASLAKIGAVATLLTTTVSLAISWFIYDRSDLYSLNWMKGIAIQESSTIVNINAGLDEISQMLAERHPAANRIIWDFYDEGKHTEVSIKRARKAYPPRPETKQIETGKLPLENNAADIVILFMAAHEIRTDDEREIFFAEIHRILKVGGKLVVTEHLRDIPNLAAYTLGAFHFYPLSTWRKTFRGGGFNDWTRQKENSFVSTFIATK